MAQMFIRILYMLVSLFTIKYLHTSMAINFKRRLKVPAMNPSIRAILQTFQHRKGLMIRPSILRLRVLIQHARPKDGTALFWLYRKTQQRKMSSAAFLHIVQINKKRQDSHATRHIFVVWDVVVMLFVVLSRFVLKHLEVLAVLHFRLGYIRHSLNNWCNERICEAFRFLAPSVMRCARFTNKRIICVKDKFTACSNDESINITKHGGIIVQVKTSKNTHVTHRVSPCPHQHCVRIPAAFQFR
mmetsp:Transcript_16903/g.27299  ORF Transcript_16903/g.27299 Transcript_16903/m.27299 type:complete len:243 (+) Transcript_16903:179-907(+)